jgi:predicted DNA-binding transcriptional regulator AlpA
MLVTHDGAYEIDGQSRSTRERLVEAGLYPKPVRITAGRIGFVRSEVEEWVRDRIAARDQRRDPECDPIIRLTAGKSGLQRLRRMRQGGEPRNDTAPEPAKSQKPEPARRLGR